MTMIDDNSSDSDGNEGPSDLTAPTTAPVTIEERPEDSDDEEIETKAPGGRDEKGRWAARQKGRDQNRSKLRTELEALRSERQAWQQRVDEMTRSQTAERQQYLQVLAARQGERPQQQPAAGGGEAKQIRDALLAERQLLATDPKRSTERYDELMDALVDARARAVAKATLEEHSKNNPAQQQQPTRSVEREVRIANLSREFPWIHTDGAAVKAAGAYRTYLIASGSPDTEETDRLALAHIATERRLGGPTGPSQRQRQAYAAPSGGSLPSRSGTRSVTVPDARMLRGTGLTEKQLRASILRDE